MKFVGDDITATRQVERCVQVDTVVFLPVMVILFRHRLYYGTGVVPRGSGIGRFPKEQVAVGGNRSDAARTEGDFTLRRVEHDFAERRGNRAVVGNLPGGEFEVAARRPYRLAGNDVGPPRDGDATFSFFMIPTNSSNSLSISP